MRHNSRSVETLLDGSPLNKMPDHWHPPHYPRLPVVLSNAVAFAFKALCMVSEGSPSLQKVWEQSLASGDEWLKKKERLLLQISNINIIAGLVLATTAVFLTTSPPAPTIITYTTLGPYCCIALSFAFALGGLIVGSAVAFVMNSSTCSPEWFTETLTRTRSRLCCTLFLMAYPFVSIGFSTSVCAIGLIVAAMQCGYVFIKVGSILCLLCPVAMTPAFLWAMN